MFESPSSPPAEYRYRGTCTDLNASPTASGWWYVAPATSGFPTYYGANDAATMSMHISGIRAIQQISIISSSDEVTRTGWRSWIYNSGSWTAGSWQLCDTDYTNVSSSGWTTSSMSGRFLKVRNIGNEVHLHGLIEATASATVDIATLSGIYRPTGNSSIGEAHLPAAYYRNAIGDWRACNLSVTYGGSLSIVNYPGFTIITGDLILVNSKYPRWAW